MWHISSYIGSTWVLIYHLWLKPILSLLCGNYIVRYITQLISKLTPEEKQEIKEYIEFHKQSHGQSLREAVSGDITQALLTESHVAI